MHLIFFKFLSGNAIVEKENPNFNIKTFFKVLDQGYYKPPSFDCTVNKRNGSAPPPPRM